MSSLPKPVQNVLHDLRERRMLPLVILLIAAIVAIPLLLSQDSSGTDVPPAAGLSSGEVIEIDGAEIADPVVLADVPGIRDFRKRLADFKQQNPFKQQFRGLPKAADKAQKDEIAAATQAAEDAAVAAADAATGEQPDTGTRPSTSTPGSPGKAGGTETRKFTYDWKIDVKAGPVGKARHRKGLEELRFVPDKRHPVLQFIQGASKKSAMFVVSRSVEDSYGKGRCAPQKNDCQFILLKVGQARTFRYRPDGVRYKVKLTGVERIKREIGKREEPQG